MNKFFMLLIVILISGCINTQPIIQTTKSYEGHYYSKKDIVNAIESLNLEKNESVWILSNNTLKRVLKNNYND